jgi:glutathione reductase (NADPH)
MEGAMKRSVDLVVIGTGEAGSTVATHCRAAGWEVAIVDSRAYGGTCGLRGCDPKKVLVGAAEIIDWERRMKGKGIKSDDTVIDWPELIRFKRTFTDPFPKAREDSFKQAGIATFHGPVRFSTNRSLQVGDDLLEAKHTVVATGAWPTRLNIPGEEFLTLSDQFLELDTLPKRIVFVGGGYIAFEFSHVAARAGSQVTILHQGEQPLEAFDPDLVTRLMERTRALGIDVHTKTKATAVGRSAGHLMVRASAGPDLQTFEADLVVHAAGRTPEIAELNLPAAGVEFDGHGVRVNEYLQSVSNSAVYAAGDAANGGGWPNTPGAEYEGALAARNLLEGNKYKTNFLGMASVVFTVPPLARVGMLEDDARRQGLKFKVNTADIASWYSSRRVAEPCAAFKVLVEEGSGRILGAHLLGPDADELTNIFVLAVRAGLSAETLKESVFVYPTQASNLQWML